MKGEEKVSFLFRVGLIEKQTFLIEFKSNETINTIKYVFM